MGNRSCTRSSRSARMKSAVYGAAAALLCIALPAAADYRVGSGATASIATGRVNLSCTDLVVSGTLNLDGGTIYNVRDVIVQPGGLLVGGNGSITLSRSFTVIPNGQFLPQQSHVQYDTNCGPGSPVAAIPTLGDGMLAVLAALLASTALLVLRERRVRDRRDITNGATK
jgi:hypothetical protein